MERRDFLKKTAMASFVVFTGLSIPYCQLANSADPKDLAMVSEELKEKIKRLFNWLHENKWLSYANSLGLNIALNRDPKLSHLTALLDEAALTQLRKNPGFEDFAGTKWIEPGYPAHSLLYHLLANPRVRPQHVTFPGLHEIDVLEDYIYALLRWEDYEHHYDIKGSSDLVLAVFAYEYRTAFKTPHHQHADIVFSRAGIGRIGNKAPAYDHVNRCYTNKPENIGDATSIAVVPARYGLFVAKRTKYTDPGINAMKMDCNKKGDKLYLKNEDATDILQPIRKVFNDDMLIDCGIVNFSEYHESHKISNILNDSAYIRYSDTLVQNVNVNSSFLVCSSEGALIYPIRLADGSFKQHEFSAKKDSGGNRYFTAYYNDSISSRVEDIEILDSLGTSRKPNDYEFPRNGPMYVHMAHDVVNGEIHYKPRSGDKEFEKQIAKKQDVPLFEDKICDGYVSARIQSITSGPLQQVLSQGILNAFSVITAPDFFPQVDDFDIHYFDLAPGNGGDKTLYYEGSVSSLANCKVPPNPLVKAHQPSHLENPDSTYTAVISNAHKTPGTTDISKFSKPDIDRGYIISSHLPDVCSSVFAPGWDVTYSGTKKDVFLSTQGLGSPFVEDMKFCAAMNGMWPVASPDAARTYQGSVLVSQNDDWERNPTAVPLMDNELGLHHESPAVRLYKQAASTGWDGECGPYLEYIAVNSGKAAWSVNFTDLGRADYVENTWRGSLDMSKLRELQSHTIYSRMDSLQRCLYAIDPHYVPRGSGSLWLVSAETVNWNEPAKALNNEPLRGFGIPKNLVGQNNDWAIMPHQNISGEGFIFVFCDFIPNEKEDDIVWVKEDDHTKRRLVCCDKNIHVCQVDKSGVAYYSIHEMQIDQVKYAASNWIYKSTPIKKDAGR